MATSRICDIDAQAAELLSKMGQRFPVHGPNPRLLLPRFATHRYGLPFRAERYALYGLVRAVERGRMFLV